MSNFEINVDDPLLNQMGEDIKKVNDSKNIFVFADKSTNIYEMSPEHYKKLLNENITKSYKSSSDDVYDSIIED